MLDIERHLIETTAPAAEPITNTEFKAHARYGLSDEDDLIDEYIKTARQACEKYCRRSFINTTWTYYLDKFPRAGRGTIYLPRGPVSSITSFEYLDASTETLTTVSTDDYETSLNSLPARIRQKEGRSYPTEQDTVEAVKIVFVAGDGAASSNVDASLKVAVRLLTSYFFEIREPSNDPGMIPESIKMILRPYRINYTNHRG